jgi:hypothetical protein
MPTKNDNYARLIDDLAEVRAQIKALTAREDRLRLELKPLGEGTHSGTGYLLTISRNTRDVYDMEAIKKKLSAQFMNAHTKTTEFLVLKTSKIKDREEATQEAAE